MIGKIYFILGPSGVGKGTSIDILKENFDDFFFPVSVTTRKKRECEKEGSVYNFISKKKFEEMIKQDDLLEYAHVHNLNYYGTRKKEILENIENGKIVIREIDIQGFIQAKKIIPKKNLVSIFLDIEDFDLLQKRIKNRSSITDEEVKQRMKTAKKEIEKKNLCDFVIKIKGNESPYITTKNIINIILKTADLDVNLKKEIKKIWKNL